MATLFIDNVLLSVADNKDIDLQLSIDMELTNYLGI